MTHLEFWEAQGEGPTGGHLAFEHPATTKIHSLKKEPGETFTMTELHREIHKAEEGP
jgi:hypothetical protein